MNANRQLIDTDDKHWQALKGVQFIKITGPFGDWIVFFEPSDNLEIESYVTTLCKRSKSVGASGVVVITLAQQNLTGIAPYYRVDAWNAGGQRITNMTEPARVATFALAVKEKISARETSHHVFETQFEPVTTVFTPSFIGVDIGTWEYADPETAVAAGSDVLVMAENLTDPRPGLSLQIKNTHVIVAVEALSELAAIDLNESPSTEPPTHTGTSINFVVPDDPLMSGGMGQVQLRNYTDSPYGHELATAAAAAAVALQTWTGLPQLNIWNIGTEQGDVVVQIHDKHRLSTFAGLTLAFFGTF
ncbi:MAG TPA: hypothetical protein H9884_10985 [Candidatus Yaniella excrementigallinarum]|nr:hypothetical protein [Candidatus Yaniella excrementigallinarum]